MPGSRRAGLRRRICAHQRRRLPSPARRARARADPEGRGQDCARIDVRCSRLPKASASTTSRHRLRGAVSAQPRAGRAGRPRPARRPHAALPTREPRRSAISARARRPGRSRRTSGGRPGPIELTGRWTGASWWSCGSSRRRTVRGDLAEDDRCRGAPPQTGTEATLARAGVAACADQSSQAADKLRTMLRQPRAHEWCRRGASRRSLLEPTRAPSCSPGRSGRHGCSGTARRPAGTPRGRRQGRGCRSHRRRRSSARSRGWGRTSGIMRGAQPPRALRSSSLVSSCVSCCFFRPRGRAGRRGLSGISRP
jgi:hypothetical protein